MDLTQAPTLFKELEPLQRLLLGVRAPAPWLATGDDNLRVTSFGTIAAVELVIAIRWLTLQGEIVPFVYAHTPASDGSPVETRHRLSDGWLLTATVQVASGTVPSSGIFVRLDIVRGLANAVQLVGTLAQGFVSSQAAIAYPLTPVEDAAAASGALQTVVVVSPAAGAEWITNVPANTRWRLHAVSYQLVTSAVGGNRESQLTLAPGGAVVAVVPSGVTQIASETRQYSFYLAAARGAGATALNVTTPLPAVTLPAGATIATTASGLDAADQYSLIRLLVEAFAA